MPKQKVFKYSEERRKKISESLKKVSTFRRRTAYGTFAKEPEKFTLKKVPLEIINQQLANEGRTKKSLRGMSVIKKYVYMGDENVSGSFYELVIICPTIQEDEFVKILEATKIDEFTEKGLTLFKMDTENYTSSKLGIQRHPTIEALSNDDVFIYFDHMFRRDKDKNDIRTAGEWKTVRNAKVKDGKKWIINPLLKSYVQRMSTDYVGFDYDNYSLGQVRSKMYAQKKKFKMLGIETKHSYNVSATKGYHLRIISPHFTTEQQFNLRSEFEDDVIRLKLDRERFKKGILYNVLFDEKRVLIFDE